MRKKLIVTVAAVSMLMAGCSGSPGESPGTSLGPSPQVPETGDAGSSTESSTSSPEPSTDIDVCQVSQLLEDGRVSGEVFGACVLGAAVAHGSMRSRIEANGTVSEGQVAYRPEIALYASFSGSGAQGELWFDGTNLWLDAGYGRGPVLGDPNSSDPEAMFAGTVGEAYVALHDPQVQAATLAQSPTWTATEDPTEITAINGEEVRTYHFVSEQFSVAGVQTYCEYWVTESFTTVRSICDATLGGVTGRTLSDYWDYGAEWEFTMPE